MSLLGAAAVLQVKDWGGGILCLLQNSSGVQLYICLISGRSDFVAIIIHGVLLSMKYCWDRRERQTSNVEYLFLIYEHNPHVYLKDSGAVFKGVRVADIIDQADDVTGQIVIGQVIKVREHFMKLRRERMFKVNLKKKSGASAGLDRLWQTNNVCAPIFYECWYIRISLCTAAQQGESVFSSRRNAIINTKRAADVLLATLKFTMFHMQGSVYFASQCSCFGQDTHTWNDRTNM